MTTTSTVRHIRQLALHVRPDEVSGRDHDGHPITVCARGAHTIITEGFALELRGVSYSNGDAGWTYDLTDRSHLEGSPDADVLTGTVYVPRLTAAGRDFQLILHDYEGAAGAGSREYAASAQDWRELVALQVANSRAGRAFAGELGPMWQTVATLTEDWALAFEAAAEAGRFDWRL